MAKMWKKQKVVEGQEEKEGFEAGTEVKTEDMEVATEDDDGEENPVSLTNPPCLLHFVSQIFRIPDCVFLFLGLSRVEIYQALLKQFSLLAQFFCDTVGIRIPDIQ
jgi:hypothetical protein